MNQSQNKKPSKLTYFYVGSFVVLFLALVIFIVLYWVKPFACKKLESIPQIEASEALTKHVNEAGTQTSYYVLIYNKESLTNELIEETVLEYANLVRTEGKDSKLAKIYLLEMTAENSSVITAIDSKIKDMTTCPVLIKVANQKVSSSAIDLTVSDINDCLNDLIYDYNNKEK